MEEIIRKKTYCDWEIVYNYTDEELAEAQMFRVKISKTIELCGEEGGTSYDNKQSCPICGSGRVQKGLLMLSKIPSLGRVAICKTIGGEVIVSKKFKETVEKYNLQGMMFQPILVNGTIASDVLQLIAKDKVCISTKTRFGVDCFDSLNRPFSEERKTNICGHEITMPKEIYVCPNHDLLGLNILSELYVTKESYSTLSADFARTLQYIGVKRGLLRPEPLYVCKRGFYEMVKSEKIPGLDFEIARIEDCLALKKS